MKPWSATQCGVSIFLLTSLFLCSVRLCAAVHGLGGEGYSLWTGEEEAPSIPAHNCETDHSHEDHHHNGDHSSGHVHRASDHSHEDHAHSHGGHSHGAHSHGGHSHGGHSHGGHSHSYSHGAHSHGGHSHGGHSHDHDHAHKQDEGVSEIGRPKTLEELELEEMETYGFAAADEEDYMPLSTYDKLVARLGQSSWGTWTMAMGSSLAVSLCSLICLIILPFILREGQTPSEGVVRILTGFGAGAMVGDAFLHQLPHAFGSGGAHSHGGHSHEHSHDEGHGHDHGSGGHAHSIQDLSVGLAVLVGLLVFFLVEKAVRYVEEATASNPELAKKISFQKQHSHKHGHRGHSHQDDTGAHSHPADADTTNGETTVAEDGKADATSAKEVEGAKKRKASKSGAAKESNAEESASKKDVAKEQPVKSEKAVVVAAPGSLLVLGYLNLFSDGVHNFTDGMALGAAFVHHGAVGGWSRTLFMLAHELPQEVGDFGILVRAGFSVTKALALNFLSASMAMAGTAFALVVGGDGSNSSIIEGFTAGGFVYIAVAGVMPDLHAQGTSGWVTLQQVLSMAAGMAVALGISLWE